MDAPKITDYCIELRPVPYQDYDFNYNIYINLKSNVKSSSMIVTSPEFRAVVEGKRYGREIQKYVRNSKSGIQTGWIRAYFRNGTIRSASLFPFRFEFRSGVYFDDIFRGTRLGSLIESRLDRKLKSIYPRAHVWHSYGPSDARRRQLKVRGTKAGEVLTIEEEHKRVKRYLRGQSERRIRRERVMRTFNAVRKFLSGGK